MQFNKSLRRIQENKNILKKYACRFIICEPYANLRTMILEYVFRERKEKVQALPCDILGGVLIPVLMLKQI